MHAINLARIIILLITLSITVEISGQETYLDNFSAVSYANNNGSSNFSANWQESGDDNSASSGYIFVTGNRLRMNYIWGENIRREADLSGATSATLSFDWQTVGLSSSQRLAIQISTNGGSTYTTLGYLTGTTTGTFNQDISAYTTANTVVRLASIDSNWGSSDDAYIDNFLITAVTSPSITINDIALDEDSGPAVFTVAHTGAAASGSFSVNYTITAGSATQGVDYTTSSGLYTGTLNFNGTVGDTEQITVLFTNDFDVEPNETFTIQFTSVTDVTVDITDTALGTIDNDDIQAVIQVGNETITEGSGPATFTVTHTGGDRPTSFTVDYAITAATASEGLDYTTGSGLYTGTLNFNDTSGDSESITVSITDDILFEAAETYTISFTGSSDSSVDISDTATGTINDNEIIPFNAPLTLFNEFNGYYDYAVTGGSLRTSDTNVCTITTSSSNTLTSTVPGTAVVERAYLFWAHSGATPDTNVSFEGQNISAFAVNQSNFGGAMFSMIGDVTALVSGISNLSTNTFDFTGLTVDNGNPYCSSTVVLGGWSLMVFYTDDSLPAVSINLYQGFDGQQNNTTNYTLDGFFAIGASGAKTTVLSWEGDIGLANNELLSVTTSGGTTTLSGDGNNNGTTVNNPFNSTIYDNTTGTTVNTTAFGLDLDTYDISALISPGESTATTNVGVGQDFVMLNAVLLKVPSNLIVGNVFEDVNYGGGAGRDLATSSGMGLEGVRVELYDSSNVFQESILTDSSGDYSFGGMANGSYSIRVVNNTINSTRGGGAACGTCLPVQTFRRNYVTGVGFTEVTSEIGGADPSNEDVAAGTLTNAQTVAAVSISSEGVVGLDFGFNFNTIVNTNEDGQGSLEQFIVNSNNLDETGLDIEANGIFDPAAGEDTSVFMIPSTGDPLGRTADANFTGGYFDISISNGNPLTDITDSNTKIDGRTQTAYSGDTNTATVGSGGSLVGTSANALPNFDRPEIQVHRNSGDVLRTQGTSVGIRNIAVYANNNAGIRIESGSTTLISNFLGVNATGTASGDIDYGVEITGGTSVIDGNYIARNTDEGIYINGGTSTLIQNNHISDNGNSACFDNIRINNGTGINIQRNLIENAASLGIDGDGISGSVTISENTITTSGQDGTNCSGNVENAGILLDGDNSSISNNIIATNGGPGIVLAGGNTSGNLISQNSIYGNGTASDALGIDLDISDDVGDGVTLNDTSDSDNGPNGAINFPIISAAYYTATNMVIEGWSRPGATIELFLTDVNQGTASAGDNELGFSIDYGEGQTYLGTVVEGSGSDTDSAVSAYTDDDGNTDNTNKYRFSIALPPGANLGSLVTATATLSNSTSEFSPMSVLKAYTIITNRRITYRVNH